MADSEDPTGIIELATETIAPVREELRQRLGGEFDERDSLAIETALLKAFISGVREGNTDTAEKVVEQRRPEQLRQPLAQCGRAR